jgi:hypothetical protein
MYQEFYLGFIPCPGDGKKDQATYDYPGGY